MSYKPKLEHVTRTRKGRDRVWHVRETVYAGDSSPVGVRPVYREHNGHKYFLVCIGGENFPSTNRTEYVREDNLTTAKELVA